MAEFFDVLESRGLLRSGRGSTDDGFEMLYDSVSDIMLGCGISTFPDGDGESLVENYFDDWHVYRARGSYGLVKLREQEHDRSVGDGDDPGVTVSFVAFDVGKLLDCLDMPTAERVLALSNEIDRVVVKRGQTHDPVLKEYFADAKTKGAYLIAEAYVSFITSLAENGRIPLPEAYKNAPEKRLSDFVSSVNASLGRTVCDGGYITVGEELTHAEKCVILATHTANTSYNSFAAEIRFHAEYLKGILRVRLPIVGSVYDKAIRADMTVSRGGYNGPKPYYRKSSAMMKREIKYHGER